MDSQQLLGKLQYALGDKIRDPLLDKPRRIYVEADPKDIVEITKAIHREFGARFCIASGMEMQHEFEILYHFAFEDDPPEGLLVSVRVRLDKDKPAVDSITANVPAAMWIEREMHELLGIEFHNHPDMRPLLLAEDWPEDVYPLRRGRPWDGNVELRI
jgi:Ni,Fe-hydrogenase III component G